MSFATNTKKYNGISVKYNLIIPSSSNFADNADDALCVLVVIDWNQRAQLVEAAVPFVPEIVGVIAAGFGPADLAV